MSPETETTTRERAIRIKEGLVQANDTAESILNFLERGVDESKKGEEESSPRGPIDELLDLFDVSDRNMERLHAKLQIIEEQVNRL